MTLLAAACGGSAPDPPSQPAEADTLSVLQEAVRQRTDARQGELQRVELSRFENDADLYVALFDSQAHWWGDFVVFRAANGKLQWTADVREDEEPGAHFGVSARGFRLPGFPDPLVEVFWSSHMGNGDLCLYEVRDRSLHLLLKAAAVDSHDDGWVYRGGKLGASYEDVDGDGLPDVILSGFMDEVPPGDDGCTCGVSASVPVRETFLWRPARRVFERRDP